jgi:CHAD domain-containing protein
MNLSARRPTLSYHFERDESIAKAVPRIARAQSKKAIEALTKPASSRERVHEARTAVKKLRGLLRLVEAALGDRYDRENARLRDLGDTLSQLRDAEVLIQTFDELFERFEEQLGSPLRRVRIRLITRLRSVRARMDLPERLHEAKAAFRKTHKRAKKWVPKNGHKGRGWNALVGGLGNTYRWGRRAMATAYDDGDDHAFHEWRKAVKYHGYHIRLLADLWPEELNGRREVLERTAELLGQDHDLAVFAETLQNEPRCFDNRRDKDVLLGLITQRQQALRAMARPLGRRLFAEPPAIFCRRLHSYWRIWRERADMRASALLRAELEAKAGRKAS